ncbi:filamentous hemagglutinin N-terminal domain-containing protein [Achromobacter sp. SD115]|uniref:two-partner secretion domain-containing protein n=1 Tax=Achromobacter sp. SD115 TaxID=2782011 RepID=UPI001A963FD8|nr:GLUG motif-containing protein [Achromobacter sp. SD115]MBO1014515.1 filamentous hemagglutinin N-terminal domain-containing protein [Achromobacter sp. SD115]
MNKIYALVWSEARQCWNVARESVRRCGKAGGGRRGSVAVLALIGLAGLSSVHAAPTGGTIAAGNGIGNIHTTLDQKQVSINQHTKKLIIDWNSFSIGADERVSFNQPDGSSIALNRVNGLSPSSILGRMDANGQVFLVNPNGIVFGKSAEVNVGGLVASTKLLSDADFNAGTYRFVGGSDASVLNQGTISAADRGSVALLGAKVSNQGVIQARLGRVALGAGNDFRVNFDGNGMLDLQVNGSALSALAENGGLLKADGGQVLMTAKAAGAALRTVVNSQGIIEAKTLQGQSGKITLDGGSDGVVVAAGRMNAGALATPGNGGTVEVRGQQVAVRLGTEVDTKASNGETGTWRIVSGEVGVQDTATSPNVTVNTSTLSSSLAATNIVLESTSGDVALGGAMAWSSGNSLKLVSARDVAANGTLTASGQNAAIGMSAAGKVMLNGKTVVSGVNGALSLDAPQGYVLGDDATVTLSGAGASFHANGQRYSVIQNAAQLQGIDSNLAGLYVLGVNLTGTSTIQSLGGANGIFSGTFDGLGNTLSSFYITGSGPHVGLFAASSGDISNLKLASLRVNVPSGGGAPMSIGALVGRNTGSIQNVSTSLVNLTGSSYRSNVMGGLVGTNAGGSIDRATVAGTVRAGSQTVAIGGLVGENLNSRLTRGTITRSTARNAVSGTILGGDLGGMGGLVGVNRGLIEDSSSLMDTTGSGTGANVGGLAGNNIGGDIERSFTAGRVQGGSSGNTGGLAGLSSGKISDSIAYGAVTGSTGNATGGAVGQNLSGGSLLNVKASGAVTDYYGVNVGGLAGVNAGLIDTGEASGNVNAGYHRAGGKVGGLVGYNIDTIEASVARGQVTGGSSGHSGGLVGYNAGALRVVNASGDVTAGQSGAVGGLVGSNHGVITSATASGNVRGGAYGRIGGVVGENGDTGEVLQSSGGGAVSGDRYAYLGGIVGYNQGLVSYSSASGKVNFLNGYGQTYGGLVGLNYGLLTSSSASGLASLVQPVGLNYGIVEY